MDTDLHVNKRMDTAESPHSTWREDSLLLALIQAIQGLEAVKHCRRLSDRHAGEQMETGSEDRRVSLAGREKEKACKIKVLGVLRELSVFHLTAWRKALRASACMFAGSPEGGDDQQHPSKTGNATSHCKMRVASSLDPFRIMFTSVWEEIKNIMDKMNSVITKLETEIIELCTEEASTVDEDMAPCTKQQVKEDLGDTPGDSHHPSSSHDAPESDSGLGQEVDDGGDQTPPHSQTREDEETTLASSDGVEIKQGEEVRGQMTNDGSLTSEAQTDFLEETREDVEDKEDKEKNTKWVTIGLTGQQEDSQPDVSHACFIRAPVGAAQVLKCEVADTLSSMMLSGSEELLSRVIEVKVRDGGHFPFPVTVVVPYRSCYRGNYRDVAVKIVDAEKRASSVTPLTTEGTYGGQRGSFAEVRVYSLGLFAVVSCLRRESYTVPRRGLSIKLPMDPRICLSYLPASFTAPVMAQCTIQPVDNGLLAAVKSRSDASHSVVSTSPLLYLTHPSSQPLRRPLSLTLPCPPDPDKRKVVQREEQERHGNQLISASPWDPSASQRARMLSATVRSSKEMSHEVLVLLGSKDKQWDVLDKVAVRNQQNGQVSFELTESFDRLLVVRLLSPVQPCHLTSLAEEIEESVCRHAVTVVLQRRREEPHAVLVAALPSKTLGWELPKLHAQGWCGLPETSSEICMCEGDQLLLRFSGNITSTGELRTEASQRITFHNQRKNRLAVHLTEVDPFGNYSSPHYKGAAIFYKVARGQLEWEGDKCATVNVKLLGEPVCKLPLTLPKKVRSITRSISAQVRLSEDRESLSDSLLLWLSNELSEEEMASLVLSLRLRRSVIHLVKLRAGDSPSAQAFHILALWRRGTPASPQTAKASQLAHCLAKSGRPDLARELLLRQASISEVKHK
ncbi:death domain-containing protein 1 [Genypterus blacodes]|uniref:death domain-containing protein 1 n=1 Tax=Genypterus blacodes TaxID=154954 RepID=UPI003F76ED76